MRNFEILDLLGEGSTATVHRARRTDRPGHIVALKTSHPGDVSAAEALRREAESLASIDHSNVIRLLDVIDDGAAVCLALQLAPGGTLASALATRPCTEAEALQMARELVDALAACHRAGVVHGDVATTNVLLGSDGSVLLADFGTCEPGCGTPGFVAPEVLSGGPATARSDVYGLGKVLGCLAADADNATLATAASAATSADPGLRPTAEEVLAMFDQPAPAASPRPTHLRTLRFRPHIAAPAPATSTPAASAVRPRRAAIRLCAKVAVALGGAMIVSGGVQLASRDQPAHAGSRCVPPTATVPPGAAVIEADVDGDGCANPVVRMGSVLTVGSDRFVLGNAGDDLLVADWDCDGDATPAVFRPASRRLALFNDWPKPGARTTPPTVIEVERTPAPPDC